MIKYPLMNISFDNWSSGYACFDTVFLFDLSVSYQDKDEFINQVYIDGNGVVYEIKGYEFDQRSWKRFFKSIAGCYKGELKIDGQ